MAERRWQWAVRLTAAAGVCSLGLLLAALLLPTYSGNTTSDGVATLTQETLVQSQGLWALLVVAVPLIASGVVATALVRRRRDDARWAAPVAWSAVGALAVVAVLAITSVGGFMLFVAVLLALGVRVAPGWGDVRVESAPTDGGLATGS